MITGLRRVVARALEREKGALARALGASLDPIRTLELPAGVKIIGVGGSTLGGSGRTPLAIAVARALSHQFACEVAFVAHGHGGRVRLARRVEAGDDATEIGDETAIAAHALAGPVFVGPRPTALALAARSAGVVVVDRLLQTRPQRLACSLLAVHAQAPWGSTATLPFGDLVASPAILSAAADERVVIGGTLAPERFALSRPVRGLRVGALATLARPERMRAALRRLGIAPEVFVDRADHAPFTAGELTAIDRLGRRHRLDAWVVDAKTATLLPRARRRDTILLSHEVQVSPELLRRICFHAGLPAVGAHAMLAIAEARC